MDMGLKKISVNGNQLEVSAATLAELLAELGYGDRLVATALNRDFVRVSERAGTLISPADRIEILVPMQGG